jgi:SpoU rRNA methylase family enzyme
VISATRKFNNRLLILLETDGAQDNSRIAQVVKAVTRWVRQVPEGKPIAFGAFAQRAVFTKGFSAEPQERTDEINEVVEQANSLGKRVALFDALHQALALFGPHQPGDTILLVSDPYDDTSKHSSNDVENEFISSGTRLATMLRQPLSRVGRDFAWKSHERERALLERITARTGGAYTDFKTYLFGFSWKGYMLGLKTTEPARDQKKWKLELRKSAALSKWHPRLYYPERLISCGNTAVTPQ